MTAHECNDLSYTTNKTRDFPSAVDSLPLQVLQSESSLDICIEYLYRCLHTLVGT